MENAFILLSITSFFSPLLTQVVYLKEARHLQALQQPHLPRDSNVVAATQQFLQRFAQLKALADAAPDPPPNQNRQQQATHQQNHHAGHPVYNLHGQVGNHQHQQQPQQLVLHHQQPVVQHHQQQPAHHQQQATHHVLVPVVNAHGIVVNPNRYPGPLAHQMPANVG
ncbi:UNVERIFIED_CONTAM: hypothetical protein RMT77_009711 [Armadillidium vulgare]